MRGQRTRGSRPVIGRQLKHHIAVLIVAALTLALSACGGEPQIKYEPPILPVKLVISTDGVAIEGDSPDLVTPIGKFSIGAKYELEQAESGQIYVIVRDRKQGSAGFDDIFRLQTAGDEFNVVVDGTTTIHVKDRRVIVDVTDGNIRQIEFKRADPDGPKEQKAGSFPWWDDRVESWNTGWETSFYTPFDLSRWAYDDSTIGKWCGIGFVWFLLRLILALVLGLVDLVLTVVFLVAQLAYMMAGSTGRNITWGLSVLLLPLAAMAVRVALE